ncbi:MAG: hypothetical protein MUF22_09005, partial [Chitinispirillaceae bacterium]|nr:hypothetical protein [Chitinispirillaceae bacterium]
MKRHMRLAAFLLALTALFISQCSNPGGGNSSDIGNPTITGKLYYVDKSPAKNAAVRLSRFTPTLADTNHVNLVTTFTDNNGVFAIDSIDTGTYIIEASDNRNNLALIDSIPVTDPAATVFLPADTLKPAGAIKGVINLVEGGDPRKVFVLMFGLDRFARVEADGSFRFNNLAEAKYDLRLIPSLNDYGILDTFDIPVVSAKTTDLDTITLPFTGIPTPKNVSIAYDTLKQIVTLRWDSLSTPLVRGYNVYRRNTDSAMVGMINPAPISDTVYRDSTGVQDQTYEYYVVAVDTSSHESKMSPKVVRKIVSAFTFIRTIGSKGTGPGKFTNPMNVSVSKSGVVLISDYTSPMAEFPDGKILFFDTTGLFKREIDSIGNPVFAQSGTLSDKIYVCEAFPASSISIIDTAGIRSNSIQLSPTSIAASPFDD